MQNCSLKFAYVRIGSLNAGEKFQRRAGRGRWNSRLPPNPTQSDWIKLDQTQSNPIKPVLGTSCPCPALKTRLRLEAMPSASARSVWRGRSPHSVSVSAELQIDKRNAEEQTWLQRVGSLEDRTISA
jgi:hypothetical protein